VHHEPAVDHFKEVFNFYDNEGHNKKDIYTMTRACVFNAIKTITDGS